MKVTKTFYHEYTTTDSTASIYINIPFKVSKIHVKNITYVSGINGAVIGVNQAVVSQYITFLSSLVGNRPVGMVHKDSQFSMAIIQDIEHIFQIPVVINGYYTFTPYTNNGVIAPCFGEIIPNPPVFDSFSITIEFHGED